MNGEAEIIETFDSKKESGAKIDLTPVLNLDNELKTATRKAVIVDDSYLKIEDVVETHAKPVNLRWNMVTPATAEIIDKNTIRLSQQGRNMLLKFASEIPFELAIRPSENPGGYNAPNKGTVMVGFDADIPGSKTAKFTVTFIEEMIETLLPVNTFILDAPNPSAASEGNTQFSAVSPIGIHDSGTLYPMQTPEWIPYGKVDKKSLLGKSFDFKIEAKRINGTKMVDAGIDRTNDGQLGIRGGGGNGIDPDEGCLLSLDLTAIDPTVTVELTKIAFGFLDAKESATIVHRQPGGKMMTYFGSDKKAKQVVKMTSDHKRHFVDVSGLGISLQGGKNHTEFLSLFNTTEGSWRISGFEFKIK